MTEDQKEIKARQMLDDSLNQFMEEVREIIQQKVNDSIYVNDIIEGNERANVSPEIMTKQIMLGWVQRILYETIYDDLGEKGTAHFFDSAYYQIGAQKIGPEDFYNIASPYENGKGKDKFK